MRSVSAGVSDRALLFGEGYSCLVSRSVMPLNFLSYDQS